MKRIVYTQDNGTLAIIIPSPKWKGTIEELATKDVPEGKTYKIVDASKIPTDRTFRGAWEDGTVANPVKTNINKARTIHMDRILVERDKELTRLDIEQLKGNDVDDLKQALRDLPTTFDLSGAINPDALKLLWPAELL